MFAPFRKGRGLAAACLLLGGMALPLRAAEATGDQKLYDVLREVINRGAKMYNSGNPDGCYRLFEGALLVARAQLDAKPELQKAIDDGMIEADKRTAFEGKAYALYDTLNKVRAAIKPPGKKAEDAKPADKKPEDKKPATEKPPEDKKPPEKKPEDKKPADKKTEGAKPAPDKLPGDKKPSEKKPEDKKPAEKPKKD